MYIKIFLNYHIYKLILTYQLFSFFLKNRIKNYTKQIHTTVR